MIPQGKLYLILLKSYKERSEFMLEENFKQIINIIKSDIKATGLKTAI